MVNREPDFFSSAAVVNLLTGIETDLSLPITSAKGLYMEINRSHIWSFWWTLDNLLIKQVI